MKRLLVLLLVILLLVGCSTQSAPAPAPEQPKAVSQAPEPKEAEEDLSNELIIYPDEIPYDITILPPDSIGTVYLEATYTNNTDYPILGYDMQVHLKDSNDITYLMNYDTVMPGETSPTFESFGPESLDYNDFEVIKLSIKVRLPNGNDMYIDYDFKLQEAEWWESEN